MFSLREFIKKGLLDLEDLAEINAKIDEKNTPPAIEETEETPEGVEEIDE